MRDGPDTLSHNERQTGDGRETRTTDGRETPGAGPLLLHLVRLRFLLAVLLGLQPLDNNVCNIEPLGTTDEGQTRHNEGRTRDEAQ